MKTEHLQNGPLVQMTPETKSAIRTAVADYMRSEGCSCCQSVDKHKDAERRLAGLLDVPMYTDGSGYDFHQFSTDPIPELLEAQTEVA